MEVAVASDSAPGLGLMALSPDGNRTLSIRVETSRHAYRRNRYGQEGYEWDLAKGAAGKHQETLWYAFVDLCEGEGNQQPRVFFVPSRWIAEFVKPDWERHMYFLPSTVTDATRDRWDLVSGYLCGDEKAAAWANGWPRERLVDWGN
jgi:hypothetical protein